MISYDFVPFHLSSTSVVRVFCRVLRVSEFGRVAVLNVSVARQASIFVLYGLKGIRDC
jgi:hypothetical protein